MFGGRFRVIITLEIIICIQSRVLGEVLGGRNAFAFHSQVYHCEFPGNSSPRMALSSFTHMSFCKDEKLSDTGVLCVWKRWSRLDVDSGVQGDRGIVRGRSLGWHFRRERPLGSLWKKENCCGLMDVRWNSLHSFCPGLCCTT